MFDFENRRFQKIDTKNWLSSPTMHGEELKYITEDYETNWMSTVGQNINKIERIAAERLVANMQLHCQQELQLCILP